MSNHFFTYESELPENIGFGIFGIWHWGWLLALGLAAGLLLRLYARLPEKKKRRWEYGVSLSMLVWIALRSVYIAVIGASFLYELPLHLCSITGVLCYVHCVTGADWIGQTLYAIGLPGTVLALLFPDWGAYPALHFVTIEGFCFHAGILLYVASQLYSGRIVPQREKLWEVMAFLAAYMIPIYLFDRLFQVNYMFLSRPSAGSPLELLLLWFGDPGYLIAYVLLILLCIWLMVEAYRAVVRRWKKTIIS